MAHCCMGIDDGDNPLFPQKEITDSASPFFARGVARLNEKTEGKRVRKIKRSDCAVLSLVLDGEVYCCEECMKAKKEDEAYE